MPFLFQNLIIILFAHLTLQAQNPNEQELQNVPQTDFENFTGVHRQIDSRNDIYNIGVYLSKELDPLEQTSNYFNKYTLIRSLSTTQQQLFDADILVLEKNAAVDHIRNLRLILSGYLKQQYGFSDEEASTLAVFISHYNAYYRENIDYFKNKYTKEVLKLLEANKVGLAKNYQQWPGATQIVIPLSRDDLLQVESTPDLAETSQQKVVEQLMEEEGSKALMLREKMVEQRRDDLQDKQQVLDQLKQEQQADKQQIEVDKERLNSIIQQSNSSRAREEAERQLNQNGKDAQLNQQQQNILDRKQQQLSQQKTVLRQEENSLQADIQNEDLDKQPLYFPLLNPQNSDNNQLVRVSLNRSLINARLSELPLRNPSLIVTDDFIYIVAGSPQARLTRLKNANLEIERQSQEEIYNFSPIWQFSNVEGFFVMTLGEEEQFFLARYNKELQLQARSQEPLLAGSSIQHYASSLLVQRKDGSLIALDAKDLTFEKEFNSVNK